MMKEEMNTSQRRDALDKEYDRLLRNWQSLMEKTTDPHAQHRLHIVGDRMHRYYLELLREIETGKSQ